MRKVRIFAAVFTAAVLLAGCQKDNLNFEEKEFTPEKSEGILISAVPVATEDAGSAFTKALDLLNSMQGPEIKSVELQKTKELFSGKLTGTKWQIETWRITYWSKDNFGEPVVLSGDIAFVNEASGFIKRYLKAVNIFHTIFNPNEDSTTSLRDIILPTRALYNNLVVYPHYQGAIANGKNEATHRTITVSEALLKARQAIDCELAALEFIENLDNVEMSEDYYTENMGASNGGAATLATQYLLENDPELKKVNNEKIKLRATYGAEGCYSYGDLLPSLLNTVEEDGVSSSMDQFKMPAALSVIIGTFDAWKGNTNNSEHRDFFEGIEIEDFFSEEFVNSKVITYTEVEAEKKNILSILSTISGLIKGDYSDWEDQYEYIADTLDVGYIEYYRNSEYYYEAEEWMTVTNIFSEDMIDREKNEFKEDSPLLQALEAAFAENDVILNGWNPASPLLMAHSIYDDYVPYSQIQMIYDNLSNFGWNRNVEVKTLDNEKMNHMYGFAYLTLADIVCKEHPNPNGF